MRKATQGGRAIYVRFVVNTDGIAPNRSGSAGDANTPIAIDRDAAQMIVTTTAGAVDAATGDITVDAAPGDRIRFYATSGSNNFEDAVLIDDIGLDGGDGVVGDFSLVVLPGLALTPAPDAPLALSGDSDDQDFWFWQSTIAGDGTQDCHAVLAHYDRDDRGRPHFAGLYRWDFPLTVTLTEPSISANEGVAS